MTIAIAFLGLNPQVELIDFYKTVDRVNHDIYYFIDNNENKLFILYYWWKYLCCIS